MSEIKYQWNAYKTIVTQEIRRFLRIWPQSLLPPVITMALYFLIFGSIIGSKIGVMDNIDYMTFVLPGLVIMSIITNSYNNVASSFFSNKFQRSIEELLVSPAYNIVILCGYVTGGIVRGVFTGVLVMLLGFCFVDIQVAHVGIAILTIVLTATVFSLCGLLNGIFAQKFDDISIIPTFVLTPMVYLGGVFYSMNTLSQPWKILSMLNPILYQVDMFRYGLLGNSYLLHQYVAFSVMIILIILLGLLSLWLLKHSKRLRN